MAFLKAKSSKFSLFETAPPPKKKKKDLGIWQLFGLFE